MNPLKPFKTAILFLYNDTKKDIKCLKSLLDGTYKPNISFKEFWCFDKKRYIKDNWMVWLVIILAFCVGYYVSAQIYSNVCNEIIMNLTDKTITPYYLSNLNISINVSV